MGVCVQHDAKCYCLYSNVKRGFVLWNCCYLTFIKGTIKDGKCCTDDDCKVGTIL